MKTLTFAFLLFSLLPLASHAQDQRLGQLKEQLIQYDLDKDDEILSTDEEISLHGPLTRYYEESILNTSEGIKALKAEYALYRASGDSRASNTRAMLKKLIDIKADLQQGYEGNQAKLEKLRPINERRIAYKKVALEIIQITKCFHPEQHVDSNAYLNSLLKMDVAFLVAKAKACASNAKTFNYGLKTFDTLSARNLN